MVNLKIQHELVTTLQTYDSLRRVVNEALNGSEGHQSSTDKVPESYSELASVFQQVGGVVGT